MKHTEQQGKITNLFATLSAERFDEQLGEQAANIRAENEAYRRQLGGSPSSPAETEDGMRQIVLGDYTNHEAPKSSPKKAFGRLAAVALTAGILGPAGIAGGFILNEFLKDDSVTPVVQPGDDETSDLKLGRIEDYTE